MGFSKFSNKYKNLMASKKLIKYFQSEKLSGAFFVKCDNIDEISNVKNSIFPKNEDPYLLFKLKYPANIISVAIIIESGDPYEIALYYSENDNPVFDESKKAILGVSNGEIITKVFNFKKNIKWIRIDPVDSNSEFGIIKLNIKILERDDSSNAVNINNYDIISDDTADYSVSGNINELKKNIAGNKISPDKTIVLFSHELTKTGAPLLCRNISSTLPGFGFNTIIVSFSKGNAYNEFKNACSQLILIENRQSEVSNLINELALLGINKSITNTVLTGGFTGILKKHSFKNIALIHEMSASVRILNAQNQINSIAKYSDFAVFPAECVREDFLKFCDGITGNSLVKTQGYYKKIFDINKSDKYKNNLISSMKLPDNTVFFCSAGSINFGKGPDLFSMIAKQLIDKEKSYGCVFHFLWLGNTNDKNYMIWLEKQIEEQSLKDRIHFIDFVNDDKEYLETLSSCEAFLHTSREDSLPSVILEAMAVKLPVVSFKGSGGAESLLSGGRGYLADYLDIENYCESVINIIENKDEAKNICERANNYLKENLNFEDYVRYLSDLLSQN